MATAIEPRKKSELQTALDNCSSDIEMVLPDKLKGQGERLIKRACLTYYGEKGGEIRKCTTASVVRAVVEAAEVGLAVDGNLAYLVRYGTEANLQVGYKGLIVIARRSGQIEDAYGDVVCKNDRFDHGRDGSDSILRHTYALGEKRGDVIGAYAIVKFPNGTWRYELMDIKELENIRSRSKSNGPNSPWGRDTNQMRIKTVLRRALKLYCDDPALGMAIEVDEREYRRDDDAPKTTTITERLSQLPAPAKHATAIEPDESFDSADETYIDEPADESEAIDA